MSAPERVPLDAVLESLPLYSPDELRQVANEIMRLDLTRERSPCTCREREFHCPFCKEEWSARARSSKCGRHGHELSPEVKCPFCHR